MNRAENNELVNPDIRQAAWDDRYDDDVSLIDLWIELTRFRNVFLGTFTLLFAFGTVALIVWHQDQYSLTSVIQVGSVQTQEQIVPLESPEALRGKLVNVLVPRASALWNDRRASDNKFITDIELVEGSDVVIIRNNTTEGEIEFFTTFQRHLAEQVIEEHRSKASVYQSGTRSALNAARLRLEVLHSRQALEARLKLIDQEIDQLSSDMKALRPATEPARADADVALVQPASRSGSAGGHQVTIRELEFRKIELTNEHAQQLAQQKSIVDDLQRALQDINHTRVISEPVRSLEPVNRSLPVLLAIMLAVAGGLASLVTLLSLFHEKVERRRAELGGIT